MSTDERLVDDEFRADLDEIRAIGGSIGLRPYAVTVIVRTWSGTRVGVGAKTDTPTTLTNGPSGEPVMVRQMTRKDVIASGGMYTDRDLRVGPITPAFAATLGTPAGGFTDATMDPAATAAPTELIWNVTGPSHPAAGAGFDKIGEEATALHYFVILRQSGRVQ